MSNIKDINYAQEHNGYDVFISCKSEDYPYGRLVYTFLTENGVKAFLADQELRKKGIADYGDVIDQALDFSKNLIVVATSANFTKKKYSPYVYYEWKTFSEEKRSGRKTGNILTVVSEKSIVKSFPIALRNVQSFSFEEYQQVYNYVVGDVQTPDDNSSINKIRKFMLNLNMGMNFGCTISIALFVFWEFNCGSNCPTATGFITNDGFFVTARQVIEPWAYFASADLEEENPYSSVNILKQKGATVDVTIVAESSSGDRMEMHYSDFEVVSGGDVVTNIDDEYSLRLAHGYGYAYKKIDVNSNLVSNPNMSQSLAEGTHLECLGFPYGMGGDRNAIRLQYSYMTTSNNSLSHGMIPVTGAYFENGIIGSPVFYEDENGTIYLVGFIASTNNPKNMSVVPISKISF